LQLASTPPRHRARCTHLQTQPGRIQPIDSSQLAIGWSSTSTRKPEPSRPATQYNYSSRR
ncbi:hypothetical protein, partial [Bordetella pertussis]|uniref:hypothetical protein n=1 Tax=Bordetella pertussis TaxID=520 RepID=UPI001E5AA6EE